MSTDARKYSRSRVILTACVCTATLSLLYAGSAFAQDINGRSRTFVTAQQTISGKDIMRAYEYIDLNVPGIIGQKVSFHASGWGRFSIEEEPADDRTDGELTYAYLDVILNAINSRVSVGRQLNYSGPAIEQFDGVSLENAFQGFSTKLFIGSQPDLDIDSNGKRRGDVIYGGRVVHSVTGLYQVGAAYVKEATDSKGFREELGFDLWFSPFHWFMFEGDSAYNHETGGWKEHSYRITLDPPTRVKAFGEFSDLDYEHYFSASTTGAFESLTQSPTESYTLTGGGLTVQLTGKLRALFKLRHYSYELSGSAGSYGFDLFLNDERFSTGLAATRMHGDTDELRYTMYRAFISGMEGKADGAIDLIRTVYDEPANDLDATINVSATLGYNPMSNLRVGISGEYSETPYFEDELKGFLRVTFKFGGA